MARCDRAMLLAVLLLATLASSHAAGEQSKQRVKADVKLDKKPAECSRTCFEESCSSTNLRYGKFCGMQHTGCADEEPCDAADACCKEHDACVGTKGMMDTSCHEVFLKCLKQVEKEGTPGFSDKCPYETVIPAMRSGIQMTIKMTQSLGEMFASAFNGNGPSSGNFKIQF